MYYTLMYNLCLCSHLSTSLVKATLIYYEAEFHKKYDPIK